MLIGVLASVSNFGFTVGKNRHDSCWWGAYSLVGKTDNEQVNKNK